MLGLLLAAAVVTPGSATAASQNGVLQELGPSGSYSQGIGVALPTTAGTQISFGLKVKNTGTDIAQYNLRVVAPANATVILATGSIIETTLAQGADGYFTTVIKAGAVETLSVKVKPNAGIPQQSLFTYVDLYSTDGNHLDRTVLDTEIKAPAAGTSAYDLFAHSGSQAPIGGPVDFQTSNAAAIKPATAASFTVRLKNDSAVAGPIGLGYQRSSSACNQFYTVSVKAGSVDVTQQATAGHYLTASLKAAAYVDITVKVTLVAGAPAGCGSSLITVFSTDSGFVPQHSSQLLVNAAVA